MKRIILMLILMLLPLFLLSAGDLAQFVNLGFAPNGRFFMFGQYGIDSGAATPYAELFLVDVAANKFVSGGIKSVNYIKAVEPGDTALGALLNIVEENLGLKNSYSIDHLNKGRVLYMLFNGETPKTYIEFRDFNTGKKYIIVLVQTASGSGENVKAAFHIDMTINTSDGGVINKKVGLPGYYRSEVKQYKIRQVILAPGGDSLVFIIEKDEVVKKGFNVRYMVETVKVN